MKQQYLLGGHRGTLSPLKSSKVQSNAQTRSVSGTNTHSRNECIQNAKGGRGSQSQETNLHKIHRLLGNGKGGNGHNQTLNDVLHDSSNQFGEIDNIVHFI
jgi:hypothetical protein